MSLSVLPLSVASYLNDQYPDYPRNQIPEPFRDKEIKPETVCRESPYDLLALWGVFSSQAAYLVSYRSIPIKGSPMYHKAAYCVMEPRQLSTFKKVSALGSNELVAANACSAKLLTAYLKIPETAKLMLNKFLNTLPSGTNLLFKPRSSMELESILGSIEVQRDPLLSGPMLNCRNLQLSQAIERTIRVNDSDQEIVTEHIAVQSQLLPQPSNDNWHQDISTRVAESVQQQAGGCFYQSSNNVYVPQNSDSSKCARASGINTSFVVTNAELNEINLQPLKQKFKQNNQLKKVQMKEYALVLNLACLYKDGSNELVAANACSAKLLTAYLKIPETAKLMLNKFLNTLPSGTNLLFKPRSSMELESILGSIEVQRDPLLSGPMLSCRNLQLSQAIERTIRVSDSDQEIVTEHIAVQSQLLPQPSNDNWHQDISTRVAESVQQQAGGCSCQSSNDVYVPQNSDSSKCARASGINTSFVVTNAELNEINLQPLRQKFKQNNQLKKVQMKEYALVLNLACLYRDARVAEFYLRSSLTPEDFMKMRPVPKFDQRVDSKLAMISDRNNCVPSVAVRQMGFQKPEVKISSKRTDASPKSKVVIPLLVELTRVPPHKKKFLFLASTEELASEAAAAKYLQFCLQNSEVPTLFLWNYIKRKMRSDSLILFRPRFLDKASECESWHELEKQEKFNKNVSPNLEVKNKLMRRKLGSWKAELKAIQMSIEQSSNSFGTTVSRADMIFKPEIDLATLGTLDMLKKHPFVNSVNCQCRKIEGTQKLEVLIIINSLYVFRETNFSNFLDGVSVAVDKAKLLMETINERGCEDVIPIEQRYDTKFLVALLELKTGLSIENVAIKFKFEVENTSWTAEVTIDDVFCVTKSSYKTQKEALNVLLSTYLIEKQSCLLFTS